MAKLRTRLANLLVIPLLRSPLHGLMGSSIMLITVTGRKTGKRYRLPVGYRFDEDHTIKLFSRKDRVWWRNLQNGQEVTLSIRRRTVRATAIAFVQDDPEAMLPWMKRFYSTLSDDDITDMQSDLVMITLQVPAKDWDERWERQDYDDEEDEDEDVAADEDDEDEAADDEDDEDEVADDDTADDDEDEGDE